LYYSWSVYKQNQEEEEWDRQKKKKKGKGVMNEEDSLLIS
jgi:hypothetical protein